MNIMDLPQVQNLTHDELDFLYNTLKTTENTGDLSILENLWLCDYEEVPVTIDQFIEDDKYLGKVFENGKLVYPFWRNFLHNLFHENPDNKWEIAITGAIGTGKSTVSAIALIYLLYRTMCLRDPQRFYGLTANSPIVFVCLNLTIDLAYSGLYSMIVEAIKLSPWFRDRVDIRGKYEYSVEFPKNISLMVASQTQHTIGKNVLGAILDEVNFSNAPKGSKNSVLDMYRNIRRRLESRFLKQGRIPGLLFLVSSKNSDLDFLDQYIQSIKHQNTTIVIDRAVYDIKPPETYTGKKFKVAVGDKTKQSRVIKSKEDLELVKSLGYELIEVPIEYLSAFEQDINDALKDIAGISSVSTNKLIPYPGKINNIVDKKLKSPLLVDQLVLGLESDDDIKDYLDDLRILRKDLHIPRFAHIDIGVKGDALGMAIVHANKLTSVERYSKTGKIESVIENEYNVDLLLSVKAVSGSEVPLFKIREFIIWLATTLGMHFEMITFDGYQSTDSIQLLKVAGLNTGLLSVDRSDTQYLNLRSCIIEGRLNTYFHPILIKELYEIEHDKKAKKVDHPLEGTKDLSDGLCGALWDAQQYYSTKKTTNTVQHQNVKEAVNFVNKLNQKRWAKDKSLENTDSWVLND